jgi:hypothetical protein
MRLLVLVGLLGCGDNLVLESADARSGERLKLQFLEYVDGTRQLVRDELFDAGRDEVCRIVQWSDGFFYCTPEAGRALYADPGCTRELGHIRLGEPAPPYFRHESFVGGTFKPAKLYRRGALAAPPSAAYELRDGKCAETRFDPAGTFYELGEEVTHDALVQTRERSHVVDERVAVQLATSSDGVRFPLALHDRELEIDCRVAGPNRTSVECTPVRAHDAVFFHDAACTQPELSAASVPAIAAVQRDGCTSYHAVGAQVVPVPLFRLTPSCTPAVAPSGEQLFLVGEQLALPALARERGEGARLQPIVVAGVGDGYLFDRQHGSDCRPLDIGGVTRCVPHHAISHPVYADDACTTPALVALVQTRACEPPVQFTIRFFDATFEVYPLVDAAPPVYEITTGDRCVPYVPPAGFALRALGAPLPAEAFASATRLHDP